MSRPLQACAAEPEGHPRKMYADYDDYHFFQYLTDRAQNCGLPASTVKLSPPALATCEGAVNKYTSIARCHTHLYMRGLVSVCAHVVV